MAKGEEPSFVTMIFFFTPLAFYLLSIEETF
jgi:hypothetical protein